MPAPAVAVLAAVVAVLAAVPVVAVLAAAVAVSPNTGQKGGSVRRRLLFAPVRPSGHQAEAMDTSNVADPIGSSNSALSLFVAARNHPQVCSHSSRFSARIG